MSINTFITYNYLMPLCRMDQHTYEEQKRASKLTYYIFLNINCNGEMTVIEKPHSMFVACYYSVFRGTCRGIF